MLIDYVGTLLCFVLKLAVPYRSVCDSMYALDSQAFLG